MTDGGLYRTRVTASYNEDDVAEVCGMCAALHNPLRYTIVTLWSKEPDLDSESPRRVFSPRWESEDKFVCSRDCLMACLTTHMIEQEALGRCRID